MKVLLIGATGATGKDLVEILLLDREIERIDIFVRRKIELKHEKLHVHQVDFDLVEEWKHLLQGDVLFSCLGTTLKAAGSKEKQWKVDYDYQYQVAKAAKENQVSTCVLVSSINASLQSLTFYGKMKGQLEYDITALHFERLIILQPPLLIREGNDRFGEVMGEKIIRFFNNLGLLHSLKPLPTNKLAHAALKTAKEYNKGNHLLKGQEILSFLNNSARK